MRRASLVSSIAVLAALGCAGPTDPSGEDRPVVLPPPAPLDPVEVTAYPTQGWLDRSLHLGSYGSEKLEELASCDVAVFPLHALLSEEGLRQIRRVRASNPDIVVLGEFPVLSFKLVWESQNQRDRFPLVTPLYDLQSRHLARTTDGEVALMWDGAPMVNPWTPNGYREDLLLDLVDHICRMATAYPGVIDGFFHDYLSGRPWMTGTLSGRGSGWVDLDGDGVDSRQDEDEWPSWLTWQHRLLTELQQRFGPGLIQVGNGRLPQDDAEFASLLAGIAYEAFPRSVWNFSDREGFERAVLHTGGDWLTPRRGRHWSLLWDRSGERPAFCRVSSMLTGQFYCLTDLGDEVRLDRTITPVPATDALLSSSTTVEGGVHYSRTYAGGEAHVSFGGDGRTLGFGFTQR